MKSSTSRLSPARVDRGTSVATPVGRRAVVQDERWPAIVAQLTALRDARRRSVRIVDADCGAGALLIRAAREARALGFTAIEGRGIDGAPALVGRAKAAAAQLHDPAIGLTFERADLVTALADETDLPADILLFHRLSDRDERSALPGAMAAAARCVIGVAA